MLRGGGGGGVGGAPGADGKLSPCRGRGGPQHTPLVENDEVVKVARSDPEAREIIRELEARNETWRQAGGGGRGTLDG